MQYFSHIKMVQPVCMTPFSHLNARPLANISDKRAAEECDARWAEANISIPSLDNLPLGLPRPPG
jgi:hypothetical protein